MSRSKGKSKSYDGIAGLSKALRSLTHPQMSKSEMEFRNTSKALDGQFGPIILSGIEAAVTKGINPGLVYTLDMATAKEYEALEHLRAMHKQERQAAKKLAKLQRIAQVKAQVTSSPRPQARPQHQPRPQQPAPAPVVKVMPPVPAPPAASSTS